MIKKYATALACLLLPRMLKPCALSLIGHRIHPSARIGFAIIWVDRLFMGPRATIGHLSVISCRKLLMRHCSGIGNMNFVRGPIGLYLDRRASIGNRNVVVSARAPLSGQAVSYLWLGSLAKITASHMIDVTRSIRIRQNSTLAGKGSQIWTHGYVHAHSGPGRARIDGRVSVGENTYIGAMSCISPSVNIGNSITVGSHSSVATDLLEPGVYVSARLRYIGGNPYNLRERHGLSVPDDLDPDVRLRQRTSA